MKLLNRAINLAIIVVVILIGVVFTKTYLLHHDTAANKDYRVAVGTKVALPGIDWSRNGETLLLVLQRGCRFCRESAQFYQRLIRETGTKRRVQLVAVLPQDVSESRQYLKDLNAPFDEVRQSALETLGVQGTPTLILVNAKGEVIESWAGKLPAEKETEVLSRL